MKFVGGADGVLTGHGVGDEQNLGRIQQLFERLHLVHELIVDVEAAGGVNDEHVAAGVHGLAAGFLGQAFDSGGIGFADFALVNLRFDGLRYNFQLLTGCRTVYVDRNQQRTMPSILEPVRQLS